MIEELISRLKQLNIVHREPRVLRSGVLSNFYIDVKRAYGDPIALNLISDELYKNFSPETTCVAALGYGGISPASVIAAKYNLNLTLIRDVPKNHGLGGFIDGHIPNESDKVSIIDDVLTTGGSLKKIISVLEPTRTQILGCHVVVKRGDANWNYLFSYLMIAEELM